MNHVERIANRIGLIYYHRPLMYGGSGEGVELLLHTYHALIAEFDGREDEFRSIYEKALDDENCGSANFANRYSLDHPGASEQEIAQYSVVQWRKISERMGVPIPHEEMKREFGEQPS